MDANDTNASEPPSPSADAANPSASPSADSVSPSGTSSSSAAPSASASPSALASPAASTDEATPAAPPSPPPPSPSPRAGIAALSPRYQAVAALALALVAVTACVHIGMLFLHVAPANTMTKQHGQAVDDWIYPEFEQNWKLFAPNPMQQNIAVQARAQVRTEDGTTRTTGWYDLSAADGAAIDGNLLPSHTQQNELRRAWDFYVAAHDTQNRPRGLRGQLSEQYIRRIAMMRVERAGALGRGATIERLQVRSRTTNVSPPDWSDEKVSTKPSLRQLPWWSVTDDDMPLGKASGPEGDAR
ncbi:DUF5819 family protein [Streptomyces sp. SYP-A7185]|uniref:DUF5819 family protein n=1 Tax=Streptomyces sp. SYP-A7185 TaxID=3040076 RepID=UPI0038F614E7